MGKVVNLAEFREKRATAEQAVTLIQLDQLKFAQMVLFLQRPQQARRLRNVEKEQQELRRHKDDLLIKTLNGSTALEWLWSPSFFVALKQEIVARRLSLHSS